MSSSAYRGSPTPRWSDQLDLDDLGGLALALADVDQPGEPGLAVGVLGGDHVEQLGHDEWLARGLPDHRASRPQVTALRERDHPLDLAADLLGLRLRRLDALVA